MINFYKKHKIPKKLYGFSIYLNKIPKFAWNNITKKYKNGNYRYFDFNVKEKLKQKENLWAINGRYAFCYAVYVINKRFEKGEKAIYASNESGAVYLELDNSNPKFPMERIYMGKIPNCYEEFLKQCNKKAPQMRGFVKVNKI